MIFILQKDRSCPRALCRMVPGLKYFYLVWIVIIKLSFPWGYGCEVKILSVADCKLMVLEFEQRQKVRWRSTAGRSRVKLVTWERSVCEALLQLYEVTLQHEVNQKFPHADQKFSDPTARPSSQRISGQRQNKKNDQDQLQYTIAAGGRQLDLPGALLVRPAIAGDWLSPTSTTVAGGDR